MSLEDLRFRIAEELELLDAICRLQKLAAQALREQQLALILDAIAQKQHREHDHLLVGQVGAMIQEGSATMKRIEQEATELGRLVHGLHVALQRKNPSALLEMTSAQALVAVAAIEGAAQSVAEFRKRIEKKARGGLILPGEM